MANINLLPFNLDDFLLSDLDAANDVKYYGYQKSNGRWYIMQETTSTGAFRYVQGTTGYSTAWEGRAELTYTLFSEAF